MEILENAWCITLIITKRNVELRLQLHNIEKIHKYNIKVIAAAYYKSEIKIYASELFLDLFQPDK